MVNPNPGLFYCRRGEKKRERGSREREERTTNEKMSLSPLSSFRPERDISGRGGGRRVNAPLTFFSSFSPAQRKGERRKGRKGVSSSSTFSAGSGLLRSWKGKGGRKPRRRRSSKLWVKIFTDPLLFKVNVEVVSVKQCLLARIFFFHEAPPPPSFLLCASTNENAFLPSSSFWLSQKN